MDETILFEATCRGKVDLIRDVLEKKTGNLNYRDAQLRTALHRAAEQAGPEMIEISRMLLAAGMEPNCFDSYGQTPLQYATANNNTELCRLLLQYSASPHAGSGGDFGTPLLGAVGAAARGMDVRGTCLLLLEHGADANPWNRRNEEVALQGAIEAYKIAVEWKGKRPIKREHITPEDAMDLIRILVMGGAQPGFLPIDAERSYLTPAQYAVKEGLTEVVRYFVLECGEDPAQRTHTGRSLTQIAGKNAEMKALLKALKTEVAISGVLSSSDISTASAMPSANKGLAPL